MAENKNVVDSFLEEMNPKDTTLKEQDPFAGLQVEQEEQPVEETKEETPVAYHEDPKLRRYIEKEIAKATKNLTPREEQRFREDVKEDGFVKAFETIIGNDTPDKIKALQALKEEVEGLRQEARSAREELESERQEDSQNESQIAQGFENIEDEFNVNLSQNKTLRNNFIDFVERISLKDEYGEIVEYPDFVESFRTYQELTKKPQNVRAKQIASQGMNRGGDATTVPIQQDYSWKGVDKLFATFKGN